MRILTFLALIPFLVFTVALSTYAHPIQADEETNFIYHADSDDDVESPLIGSHDRWSMQSPTVTYSHSNTHGGHAAHIATTNYGNGDSRWYFNELPVDEEQGYTFNDWSESSHHAPAAAEYHSEDDAMRYEMHSTVPDSGSRDELSLDFTLPDSVSSMTIYQALDQNGTRSLDDMNLTTHSEGAQASWIHHGYSRNTDDYWDDQDASYNDDWEYMSDTIHLHNEDEAYDSDYDTPDSRGEYDRERDYYRNNLNSTQSSYHTTSADYHDEWDDTYDQGSDDMHHAQYETDTYGEYDNGNSWDTDDEEDTPNDGYDMHDTNSANGVTEESSEDSDSDHQHTYDDDYESEDEEDNYDDNDTDDEYENYDMGNEQYTNDNSDVSDEDATDNTGYSDNNTYETFPQGMITFSFDDGHRSIYDVGIPMLNAAGIKSTQAIVTAPLGDTNYMTHGEIVDMWQHGHEIASHTQNHAHLTSLSDAEIMEQLTGSRNELLSLGITPVDTFVYPFGEHDANIINMVARVGYTGARGVRTGFNSPSTNRWELNVQHVTSDTTLGEVEAWIDHAREEREWLILELHQQTTDGGMYSNDPALLEDIINYVASQQIKTVTLGEGIRMLSE